MKARLPIESTAKILAPIPLPATALPLRTALDVRREMAKVYRDVKVGMIESQQGTRLVYILSQIGRMIELHELEDRLLTLESKKENHRA